MRLRQAILVVVFVLIGGAFAAAQEADKPGWLNEARGKELVQQLVGLGIQPDVAGLAAISSEPELLWLSIHTEPNQKLAVLFIPCVGDLAYAYLMRHIGDEWKAADYDSFDCHYDDSVSLEVATLANKHAQDVLVHHACVSHGTGFVQQDFQVLTIRDGKFKGVLDTEEIVNAANDDLYEYQRSSFVIVPSPEGRVIEETRSTTLNGKLTVERRYFRWLASKGAYRASKFARISVPLP